MKTRAAVAIVFAILVLGIGAIYYLNTYQTPDSSIDSGTYVFEEVSSDKDLNETTTAVWGHTLTINEDRSFDYEVDGRMVLIRVTGIINYEDGVANFIVEDNYTDEDNEPFPKFDPGSILFSATPDEDDGLNVRWMEMSANLEEYKEGAIFESI